MSQSRPSTEIYGGASEPFLDAHYHPDDRASERPRNAPARLVQCMEPLRTALFEALTTAGAEKVGHDKLGVASGQCDRRLRALGPGRPGNLRAD